MSALVNSSAGTPHCGILRGTPQGAAQRDVTMEWVAIPLWKQRGPEGHQRALPPEYRT